MKNKVKILLLTILLYGMIGCKKDHVQNPDNSIYEETLSGIKKGEPVLLTFSNSNNTTKVDWTVTPNIGVSINAVGNNATIVFNVAGTYSVVGKAGTSAAKYKIEVIDSLYVDYGNTFNLSAAKLVNINEAEPIVFSVHNAKPGAEIIWSVYSSSYNLNVDTANNTATVTFNNGGYGSVTASDGSSTQRKTVWINDFTNTNANEDTVSFILGEKLHLQPSVQNVGGNKKLIISATTTNSYHCATDKILSFSINNEYMIDYAGVTIVPQPCSANNKATCNNSFTNIPAGNHPFSINFENQTFTGSLNVSNTGIFTFTWPNSKVVDISPLEVQ